MTLFLVVPVLHYRFNNGRLDLATTRAYAKRAVKTWTDRFLLSGSIARGHLLSSTERAALLELWCGLTDPDRIVVCCWSAEDVQMAERLHVQPIVVLRGRTSDELTDRLRTLPANAYVYSHPTYTAVPWTAEVAAHAISRGELPAGAKVSKTPLSDLRALRAITGPQFELWHGTSRTIAQSLDAGASGVVSAPLSVLPQPFPARSVRDVQQVADVVQEVIDQAPSATARRDLLHTLASFMAS